MNRPEIQLTSDATGNRTLQPVAARQSSLIDPVTLMAVKNLEFRARIVVEGFWKGLHRSPFHGFSVEFTEYRPYTNGDDLRYLDWRLYARTDRYFIKKYEDETNLSCFLLVDKSRSMSYGSRAYSKLEYANTLAATLAYFLWQQGDATGLLSFDSEVREYLPARHRPGHLRHLMLALEKPSEGQETDLAQPLQRALELVKRRGLLIFLSDLLAPVAGWEAHLRNLRACGHEVLIFQVLDPAELTFGFDKPILFHDMETGQDLYIDPALARKSYLERLAAHNEQADKICQKLGIGHFRFTIERPLELALADYLRARSEQGKRTKRVGMRPIRTHA